MPSDVRRFVPLFVLLMLGFAVPAASQDGPQTFAWSNSTEFAFVTASGNASSTTIGLTATLEGEGPVRSFKLEVGGIRANSEFVDRVATGTGQDDFVLSETVREETSAERYFSRARFDRDLGESRLFLFAGAGWERDTFAGFDNRYSFVAGIGDVLLDTERTRLEGNIGGTYTIQQDVEPTPDRDEGFGGVRAEVEFFRDLTATADFESTVIGDGNLADTEDLRLDWVSSVSVSLTDGLALKTSYRMLFDNQPALVGVPLFDAGNNPLDQEVLVSKEQFDNFVTVSLVISL